MNFATNIRHIRQIRDFRHRWSHQLAPVRPGKGVRHQIQLLSCGDRPQIRGAPLQVAGASSRQAVCGASRSAEMGQMLKCGDRPQIRGARAPQVPPWASPCSCSRLPPAGADDTGSGRFTAGRTSGTGDDDVKQQSDCFSDTGFVTPGFGQEFRSSKRRAEKSGTNLPRSIK